MGSNRNLNTQNRDSADKSQRVLMAVGQLRMAARAQKATQDPKAQPARVNKRAMILGGGDDPTRIQGLHAHSDVGKRSGGHVVRRLRGIHPATGVSGELAEYLNTQSKEYPELVTDQMTNAHIFRGRKDAERAIRFAGGYEQGWEAVPVSELSPDDDKWMRLDLYPEVSETDSDRPLGTSRGLV